ncbi:TPA: hypothetical protein R4K21_003222 [Stenotrophomonas maltophilia]|nr:hypothetical protein [Stenotrophomonas maltophilia]
MANIKYADPSYTDTNATDDDRVMLRTGSGADARAPLVQPKGYIDGLKMVYVSGTQIQVTAGAAYVPGPKRIAELAAATTLTPSLAASTWYHLFLTVSGATVGVEAVTTAPGSPYSGTARAKTGDTSRRYIGSFRTNASSQIMRFTHCLSSGDIRWGEVPGNAPLRILASGAATTSTDVSASASSPLTTSSVFLRAVNTVSAGGPIAYIGSPVDGTAVAPGTNYTISVEAGKEFYTYMPLVSQNVKYIMSTTPASGGLFLDVLGFQYDR